MNDNSLIADIEGYVSVFNDPDLNGDLMDPGAFRNTLADRREPVRMLYQHAAENPIGRWTSFAADTYGLFATGELLLSSAGAREVYALLKGGALDGLSIGYQTVKARKAARRIAGASRRIVEAELWEVSVVTFPMARRARITHVGLPRPDVRFAGNSVSQKPRRALIPSSAREFAGILRSAASTLTAPEAHYPIDHTT